MAATIIIGVAFGAWQSWGRLRSAERLAYVTEASTQFFTGLHNLRVDRSQSLRDLRADKADGVNPMLRDVRGAEVPALKAGLVALREAKIADGQNWLGQVGQA
ncbi:MAG: hypothetical protein Q8K85_09615, partial [Hyphomicrobium sp.]|nr:hypothetical protein [Hyphomicrobium sp.]